MTCEVKRELTVFRVDVDAVRVGEVVEEVGAHFKVNVGLPVPDLTIRIVAVPVLLSNGED